ncbi:hypothetical protein HYH03_003538 [Edaphochlamys debaryana]|uniref:Endonuclease/exonuclease/phosphatase domain-containing protein n=1 Tax=Edaphochlamys debaryana TaxID=47281 RepID=A0A835YB83_9CHLO|nr:hypothetical protein HYH03_003538 [Edaphochlamys debaryana]|eukprot:KAG2498277.1 hypothetical protein HYH03_003538 [Edaphochlamys debaryana]
MFSCMTYNILAQKYASGGWHSYCAPQHLAWEWRKALLLEEIAAYSSDIVCLQEVEAGVFASELQPWMAERGYEGHYLSRQSGPNVQGPPEGVALFYRTAVFEALQVRTFAFSAVPTDPAPPLPPALCSDGDDAAVPSALSAAVAAASAAATRGAGRGAASDVEGEGEGEGEGDGELSGGASTSGDEEGDGEAEAEAEQQRRRRAANAAASPSSAGATALAPALSGRASRKRGRGRSSAAAAGGFGVAERAPNAFWPTFLRRQEGAILALLRHRGTGRQLVAACTHLFWNPSFPDVKAFQASVLCRELAAFVRQHCGQEGAEGRVPVVLAGDFNSLSCKMLPDVFDPRIPRGGEGGLVSGVYTLLTRGTLPPEHPDHPATRRRPGEAGLPEFRGRPLTSSGLRLASSYCLAHGRDPALTTRTNTFAGTLDYIFITPQNLHVRHTLELPYDDDSSQSRPVRDPLADVAFPPIPNEAFPSDHLSLAAVLKFK